jgi:AraC-like DNA-binding protein
MSMHDKPGSAPPPGWQLVFTTDSFPERDRLAAFREEFAISFGGIEVSKLGEKKFEVSVHVHQVGSLSCAKFSASPTLFKRTSKLIQDGDDSIFLLITRIGNLQVWQRDVRRDLLVGDVAFVCNGERRGGVVDGEGLAIQLPYASLTRLLPKNGGFTPGTLLRDAPHTKLLLGYINSFLDLPPSTDMAINDLISRHVIDLVALAIGPSGDAKEMIRQGGVRAARLRAIKADVEEGIGARDLSVSAVAKRHGVSPRYVQMLFEREGMTFSEFVLAERLARAHRLLVDSAHLGLKVSEIAYSVGFSDLSYFNRTFRLRFGMTPSDVRAAK